MLRQYGPSGSRARMTDTPRGKMETGVIPIGTICNVRGQRKVIVEAWLPRDYACFDNATRKFTTKRIRGGHLAMVRRLDNGQRFPLSDVWLLDTEEMQ